MQRKPDSYAQCAEEIVRACNDWVFNSTNSFNNFTMSCLKVVEPHNIIFASLNRLANGEIEHRHCEDILNNKLQIVHMCHLIDYEEEQKAQFADIKNIFNDTEEKPLKKKRKLDL